MGSLKMLLRSLEKPKTGNMQLKSFMNVTKLGDVYLLVTVLLKQHLMIYLCEYDYNKLR